MSPTDKIETESAFIALIEATVGSVFAYRPEYDWVGVYLLEDDLLTVRREHYIGQTTDSDRIPLTEGICGAAAREKQTIVVDDVNNDPRYIACSLTVKSEIVVPIMSGDKVIGVLDLDSDTPAAFGDSDRTYLENVAAELARAWEQEQGAGDPIAP